MQTTSMLRGTGEKISKIDKINKSMFACSLHCFGVQLLDTSNRISKSKWRPITHHAAGCYINWRIAGRHGSSQQSRWSVAMDNFLMLAGCDVKARWKSDPEETRIGRFSVGISITDHI